MNSRFERDKTWLLNEKYAGQKSSEFDKDVLRLKNGEPLDYIIGHTPFLGCTIGLGTRPLIPRAETEFWVEKALQVIPKDTPTRVLDLFAGSGCIGLAILKHRPNATVDFGEKAERHVGQIERNLQTNHIDPARAKVHSSDMWNGLPKKDYDFIFANPPYVARSHEYDVAPSVIKFEPHEALFAEDEGLFFVKRLISESPSHLVAGGTLYIEFDHWQKEAIDKLFQSQSVLTPTFLQDQYDKWRVVKATK